MRPASRTSGTPRRLQPERSTPVCRRRGPAIVQEYLAHAVAAGTPLASAVRLRMHGSIKLKRWRKFRAEQVIVRERGMIWRARVRVRAFTIRGEDRFLDGEATMNWKILGVLPLLRAAGADVTRSAAGRVAAEAIWLPSMLATTRSGGTPTMALRRRGSR
jgi:hypothetical protein